VRFHFRSLHRELTAHLRPHAGDFYFIGNFESPPSRQVRDLPELLLHLLLRATEAQEPTGGVYHFEADMICEHELAMFSNHTDFYDGQYPILSSYPEIQASYRLRNAGVVIHLLHRISEYAAAVIVVSATVQDAAGERDGPSNLRKDRRQHGRKH
jgi:hypothetical protein